MRLILSILILVLIGTYLVIPLVKHFKRFGKTEVKRIDEAFNNNEDEQHKNI
ncbi:hypothetical protein [Lederbergia lenta]|uniref:hypothetical protein n=1 Tax=Lederbergia lenta TaxID=1467 RepID=UPI00203B626A|nr:hypothetical protein [Lederbergia lenta]MCM3109897.1 hypothetical protein [Lederbergia lenta]